MSEESLKEIYILQHRIGGMQMSVENAQTSERLRDFLQGEIFACEQKIQKLQQTEPK